VSSGLSDGVVMSIEILDPTFELRAWRPARRRRILLAAYIDFLLFSVPWALLVFSIQRAFPSVSSLLPLTKFIVFGLLEGLLFRLRAWSPGAQILGIRFVPLRDHASPIDQLWQGLVPYVSNELQERESWYTLALGVWFLNEGCKSLVRWTMWNPPVPFFGSPTDEVSSAIIYLVSGGFELFMGFQLCRVELRAAFVGVPYLIVQATSALVSWQLWDDWVAEMITRRRDFQGIPVREGEIEQMQAVTPEFVIAAGALSIVLLLIAIPRLRPRAVPPEDAA